jgi:hypothetical protein
MDGENLAYLEAGEATRYKILEDLFGRPGWKTLEIFLKKEADEAMARGALAKDWETNRVELGIRLAHLRLAALKESTEREFTELVESRKEAKLDKEAVQFE